MSIEHRHYNVVIIPGLSDDVKKLQFATAWWRKRGLNPHVIKIGWYDESNRLQLKIDEILQLIDKLSDQSLVSLVGTSAGGSLAFNIFLQRMDTIHKAVSICGRLRAGKHRLRSLERMSAQSPLFKQSVLAFEKSEPNIPVPVRLRMMTVSAMLGDELVPADTSVLKGAYNTKVLTGEHAFSIAMSLTLLAKPMIDFVQSDKLTMDV